MTSIISMCINLIVVFLVRFIRHINSCGIIVFTVSNAFILQVVCLYVYQRILYCTNCQKYRLSNQANFPVIVEQSLTQFTPQTEKKLKVLRHAVCCRGHTPYTMRTHRRARQRRQRHVCVSVFNAHPSIFVQLTAFG